MPDRKAEYVVETPQGGVTDKDNNPVLDPEWRSVHRTDDLSDAQRVAGEYPRARVRRFWVQYVPVVRDTLTPKTGPADVSNLVDFQCPDHLGRGARGYPGGTAPRCSDCGKAMVSKATLAAMDEPVDLEGL